MRNAAPPPPDAKVDVDSMEKLIAAAARDADPAIVINFGGVAVGKKAARSRLLDLVGVADPIDISLDAIRATCVTQRPLQDTPACPQARRKSVEDSRRAACKARKTLISRALDERKSLYVEWTDEYHLHRFASNGGSSCGCQGSSGWGTR